MEAVPGLLAAALVVAAMGVIGITDPLASTDATTPAPVSTPAAEPQALTAAEASGASDRGTPDYQFSDTTDFPNWFLYGYDAHAVPVPPWVDELVVQLTWDGPEDLDLAAWSPARDCSQPVAGAVGGGGLSGHLTCLITWSTGTYQEHDGRYRAPGDAWGNPPEGITLTLDREVLDAERAACEDMEQDDCRTWELFPLGTTQVPTDYVISVWRG